jgi:AcrR family transcriptional regulator
MAQPVQTRSIQTRDRLIREAEALADESGLAGLRTDVIVARAGVAKGTFFAHFPDKDHLIAILVARRFTYKAGAVNLPTLFDALLPLFDAMSAEPEVLSVLARFAGPAGKGAALDRVIGEVGAAIATDLSRLQSAGEIRTIPDAGTLAEGILAFLFHAAASAQCTLTAPDRQARHAEGRALLRRLVSGWLAP